MSHRHNLTPVMCDKPKKAYDHTVVIKEATDIAPPYLKKPAEPKLELTPDQLIELVHRQALRFQRDLNCEHFDSMFCPTKSEPVESVRKDETSSVSTTIYDPLTELSVFLCARYPNVQTLMNALATQVMHEVYLAWAEGADYGEFCILSVEPLTPVSLSPDGKSYIIPKKETPLMLIHAPYHRPITALVGTIQDIITGLRYNQHMLEIPQQISLFQNALKRLEEKE